MFVSTGRAQVSSTFFYALENLTTDTIVQRGTTTELGIPQGRVVLSPDSDYRMWQMDSESLLVGYADVVTPGPGQTFTIPPITLRDPETPDSDNDGLHDEGEFIVGTNPVRADTDEDGVSDGEEVRAGTNPLDNVPAMTGVLAAADSPGLAADIAVGDNLVALADGEEGITLFNVFNGLNPLVVAQVATPSPAIAVAMTGTTVTAAAGTSGLLIIDAEDGPSAAIVRVIAPLELGTSRAASASDEVRAVVASGDLVFAGTSGGRLGRIDLQRGLVLESVDAGGRVEDLALAGDYLYAYVGSSLQIYKYRNGPLERESEVESQGFIESGHDRGGIAVGGGVAYLVHRRGYNTFDVSDPENPTLIAERDFDQSAWTNAALTGSGLLVVTAGPNNGEFGDNRDVSVFDADPARNDPNPVVSFPVGSDARDLAICNGLAYVACHEGGMQVVNYLPADTETSPPTGLLKIRPGGTTAYAGSLLRIEGDVVDDVQVRNVEFRADDQRLAVDCSYPFEYMFRVPSAAAGRQIELRAIVRDTGGNRLDLGPIIVTILPDTVPPVIGVDSLANAGGETTSVMTGDEILVDLDLFDNVEINPDCVRIFLNGNPMQGRRVSASVWAVDAPVARGVYEIKVQACDWSGNQSISEPIQFRVRAGAVSRSVSVHMDGDGSRHNTVSRSVSVHNDGDPETRDAVSRSVSVHNDSDTTMTDAVSRSVSVENAE